MCAPPSGRAAEILRGRADYLVISHPDFLAGLEPLVRAREGRGLRVKVVDVEDVYRRFSHGIFDPQAIQDFLAYAYANWQAPAPSVVVLVGDGSVDFLNNTGAGFNNHVPPMLVSLFNYGETPGDNNYVMVSGADLLPDMYIGRLPGQSAGDLVLRLRKR